MKAWAYLGPSAMRARSREELCGSTAILCIDDEEPALLLRRRVLERAGYRVFTALSGREGTERFRYHPTDVVIVDYWMAGMNGLDVAAQIKAISPKTPV